MKIINNNNQLNKIIKKLERVKYIIIDTEFVRSNTYYPLLCLIQIADQEDEFIIDCLSKDLNFLAIEKILFNSNIIKIFHSCQQDIDVIFHKFGKIVFPIFDTQIAANICGMGYKKSLSNLSQELIDISIDKSIRYSDWSQRPLSDEQLKYAINDIVYLREIYYHLIKLMDENKINLMNKEIKKISKLTNYINLPDQAWTRVRRAKSLTSLLPLIKKIAKWREINAKKFNIPRRHLLQDSALIEIAQTTPLTIKHLHKIKNIGEYIFIHDLAEELILLGLDEDI